MSDVEFYGENESSGVSGVGGTRFTPQQPQQWQGQASGGRGMIGMVMRWFGISNESVANYILIGVAVAFFVAALIVFIRT